MDLRQAIQAVERSSIRLDIGGAEQYVKGGTRFGGQPDVPPDFVWPTFATAIYGDEEVRARPLGFLAQFNCAEMAKLDQEGLLPKTGVLSFFYEMDSQLWGFDPKDAGCARVFWFADVASLVSGVFPEELQEDFRLPCLAIKAEAEISWPDWEDFCLQPDIEWEQYDEFEEERAMLGYELPEDSFSKLLGWPNVIQNNMTRECELVSRGYYLGNNWKEIPDKEIAEVEQSSLEEWRLLFQLDVVTDGNFELMFGDCGCLYFYIRKEDLLNCRFDRIWLISQCY